VSDFDGVKFHISTLPESKSKIVLSIQIRCFKDLVKYGAQQVLAREYGPYVRTPVEPGYDFSVQIDLDQLPASKEERDELVQKMALLKRNAMAAPFELAYDEHRRLHDEASRFTSEDAPQGVREGGDVMAIHYREEEAIYVKASHDRVTVIFSTIFREETDRVFGKVFIQEFVDARRRAIQNAPQVLFRSDPPLELQGVPGVQNSGSGEIGYVTFGVLSGCQDIWALTGWLTIIVCSRSLVPPTSHPPEDARGHFAHPDLPRLLPLPHQGIQGERPSTSTTIECLGLILTYAPGIHPFSHETAHSRLPSR